MASRSDPAGAASRAAADWLGLAAAPSFATMALLSAVFDYGMPAGSCSTTPSAVPMNGMAVMYLLMSVFHLAPWLRLAGGGSSSTSA